MVYVYVHMYKLSLCVYAYFYFKFDLIFLCWCLRVKKSVIFQRFYVVRCRFFVTKKGRENSFKNS